MSQTEIFRLGGDNPEKIGYTKNSMLGALLIWDTIAMKYFGLESFPVRDKDMRDKVWNAFKYHKMPKYEKIVLLSTWDNAVVSGKDIPDLLFAFNYYHKVSNLKTQAVIIKQACILPHEFVAWNQTSVNSFWGRSYNEFEEEIWYDPHVGSKHINVFEYIRTMEE